MKKTRRENKGRMDKSGGQNKYIREHNQDGEMIIETRKKSEI